MDAKQTMKDILMVWADHATPEQVCTGLLPVCSLLASVDETDELMVRIHNRGRIFDAAACYAIQVKEWVMWRTPGFEDSWTFADTCEAVGDQDLIAGWKAWLDAGEFERGEREYAEECAAGHVYFGEGS